jgi:tRNA-2-methylthio-N6-dimethylallyladenosine synthase
LRAAGDIEGIRRVRYVSPHPKDMRVDVLEAMANTPAVCEHLHYPLQSGSDRVLSLMHRGYTAERYMERLADARRLIPDLSVTTDIIVGFPGETEADFQCTLEIAAEAMFDNTFEYIFSPREGTQAADMTEHFIDPAIVSDRFDRLKVVVEHSALIKHEARIGRIEEVVVQGPSRRNPNVYSGRTRQYKLVHFSSDVALRPGTYTTVEITKAAPHFLTGFLVEVLQMATHKIRIPVVSE